MTALYIFGAFLVVLLAGVVLAPLVEREPPDEELEELPPEERREAAVEALAEIEFEYRTDKLTDEDYRRLRTHYGHMALAAEEEMEGGGAAADGQAVSGGEGAAGRAGEPGSEAPPSGPAEAAAEDARPSRSCSGCGARVPEDARFCPGCGERLKGDHEEA